MSVTPKLYGLFLQSLANKQIDMDSDTFKVALFSSTLSINQDTNQYFDSSPYTANEVPNGSGYTTGGVTVSPGSLTYDGSTNRLYFDYSDAVWTSLTLSSPGARYAILYDSTPSTSKPLVLYADLGADQIFSGGTLTLSWNASGAGYLSVA